MILKLNRPTECRLSTPLFSKLQKEKSSRHCVCMHRHSSKKKAKTEAELELTSSLNKKLLWLFRLLPNLNCKSRKGPGLYMLLAVVIGSLTTGCMTPKSTIIRKNCSLVSYCYLFLLSWHELYGSTVEEPTHSRRKDSDLPKLVIL